jgi:hypothetical protein
MNRRQFLKRVAAAGGAVAVPMIIPASALGRDGAVAPSERIVMAGIGLGGRGTVDLCSWILPDPQAQFVAICDVRRERREAIKALADKNYGNTDCKMYIEMMDVLARPDIDAILTATSDRLHATVSIRAMRAGKDVYTEKPASMTVAEGQAVVRTARQYGRVYQAGMQRLSEANFIVCNELLRLGRLGEVKTVYRPFGAVGQRQYEPRLAACAAVARSSGRGLGPLAGAVSVASVQRRLHPWRLARPARLLTSVIGEWGSHTFAQCHDALELQNTSPVHYPYVPTPTADGMAMRFANASR